MTYDGGKYWRRNSETIFTKNRAELEILQDEKKN